MTYLEWRSILKCERTVTCWEATRCKVKREKVKVESKKWKDNNRTADDRLSRKSRKRKKKKNKERDFRSGYSPIRLWRRRMGPRGGGGRGGDALRARAPRGRSLPPSPLFLSPPPFPGGRTPDPISIELYRHISFAIRFSEMAKPSLRLCIRLMANGECKISNFHYSIIDYLLNGWVDSKMLSPIPTQ